MSQNISRAESWEAAYQAFNQINFTAFDYNSIKQSITDYIKLYFPESFNDFIESSDFIAMIEVFAYLGELLIYRVDVSSHENFMSVAQRKQNVLRLAKLISYKSSRNMPARGLLKITSISTTQDIYDVRGNSLKGSTVIWNDVNNLLWQDQFLAIFNAATVTNFGTVTPQDRVQVDNVLFELYSLNNVYTMNGVVPYTVNIDGSAYPMEIVPVSVDQYGPIERRPEYNSNFTLLYGADGFGNSSPTTGFFFFTKQGKLTSQRFTFDGKTPNQYTDLPDTNINDTDLWINNIDPVTQAIVDDGSIKGSKSGAWQEVDTTSAQNVVFSYTSGKNRYETETLENDQVRIAFGDGEFANIPSGTFDAWYRISANEDLNIPQNAIVDTPLSIPYIDAYGQSQTLSFTVSLIMNVQNASASEDIEHIRSVAPSIYYTQDRMVNAADYNLYPLKDPSILKILTVNRTYVGDSKFSNWHDASTTYENVKIVGDDLSIKLSNYSAVTRINNPLAADVIFNNYVLPILASPEFYAYMYSNYVKNIRKSFTTAENLQIKGVLNNNIWPDPVWIVYDTSSDTFSATTTTPTDYMIEVDATVMNGQVTGWIITNQATKLITESPTTKFWSANGNVTVPYDTIVAGRDSINILKANVDKYKANLLSSDVVLTPSAVYLDANDGLQDVTKLEVMAYDSTDATLSGITLIGELLDPIFSAIPVQQDGSSSTSPTWTSVAPPVVNSMRMPPPPTPVPPLPVGYVPTDIVLPLSVNVIRPIPPMVAGVTMSPNTAYFSVSKDVVSFVPTVGSELPVGVTVAAMGATGTPSGRTYSIQGIPSTSGSFIGFFQATTAAGEVSTVPYSMQVALAGTTIQTSPSNALPTLAGATIANSGDFITIQVANANPNGAVLISHTVNDIPDGVPPGLYLTTNGTLIYNALVTSNGVHNYLFQFTNGDSIPNGTVCVQTIVVGAAIPVNPTNTVTFPASVPTNIPTTFTIGNGTPNSSFIGTFSQIGSSDVTVSGTFDASGTATGTVTLPSAGVWNRVFTFGVGLADYGSILVAQIISVTVSSVQNAEATIVVANGPANGNISYTTTHDTAPSEQVTGIIGLDSSGGATFVVSFVNIGLHHMHCVFSDGSTKNVDITIIQSGTLSTNQLNLTSQINYQYLVSPYLASVVARASKAITSVTITTGAMPPGLNLSVTSGDVSGVYVTGSASATGSYTGTITAQLIDGTNASSPFTINVIAYQATGNVTFAPGIHDWVSPVGIKTFNVAMVGGAGAGGIGNIDTTNGAIPHNGSPGYAGGSQVVTATVDDSKLGTGISFRIVIGEGAPGVSTTAIQNGISAGGSVGLMSGGAGYNGGGGGGASTSVMSDAIVGSWAGVAGGRGGDGGNQGIGGDGGAAQNYPTNVYSNMTGVGGAGGDTISFVSQAGSDGYVTISW